MEDLINYGYTPILDTEGYQPARITAVHRERYQIVCEEGVAYARLKKSEYFSTDERVKQDFPTVGDFVLMKYNDCGDSIIVKTLQRKSIFERKDPSSKLHRSESSDNVQAVAANFDYVFILSSLNYDLNLGRLERYLTLAWQSGAIPVIVLTKADLMEDYSRELSEVTQIAGFADVIAVSSKTGKGLEKLSEYLKPRKTIVFLGSSGVGKSSLVNAIAGTEIMKVNGIREDDSKGRHTTTHRQLIKLESGAMIIDTPGMREIGMWNVTEGICEAFTDVEEYIGKCKFSNCTHQNEPGCAILIAIENEDLTKERFENYNKLRKEAKYSDDKDAYHREHKQIGKKFSKWNKAQKKFGKSRL